VVEEETIIKSKEESHGKGVDLSPAHWGILRGDRSYVQEKPESLGALEMCLESKNKKITAKLVSSMRGGIMSASGGFRASSV